MGQRMANLELELENKRLLAYMRIIMDQACTPQTLTDPGSIFNRIINLTAAAISHSNNASLAGAHKRLRDAVKAFQLDDDPDDTVKPMFDALAEITKLEGAE